MYQQHPVIDIEGVGEATAGKLASIGIHWAEQLLTYSVGMLGTRLRQYPELGYDKLDRFRQHAELIQVTGNGQHAEGLYAGGIRNLSNLFGVSPASVVEAIDQAIADGLIKEAIDEKRAREWQLAAVQYHYTGAVRGRVQDGDVPVARAKVYWDEGGAETAEDGSFWLPGVPGGGRRIVVRAEGHGRATLKVRVEEGAYPIHTFKLAPATGEQEVADESQGQFVQRFETGDRIEFVPVDRDDLEEGTPLHLAFRYKDGDVKLNLVHRKKAGDVLQIRSLRLPGDAVGPTDPLGTVYELRDGGFEPTGRDIGDYRLTLRFAEVLELGYELEDIVRFR